MFEPAIVIDDIVAVYLKSRSAATAYGRVAIGRRLEEGSHVPGLRSQADSKGSVTGTGREKLAML